MGSPLLQKENAFWHLFFKLETELRGLDKGGKPSWACRRQLRLLQEKNYKKLGLKLVEKCESAFCFGDDIAGFTEGLLKLAEVYTGPLVDDFLALIIRVVFERKKNGK